MEGEEGAGRGADCVLVCAREEGGGRGAGCLLMTAMGRVCWFAVLAVRWCVLGEEVSGRCAGCLFVCAWERGNWSLCWLSACVC